MSSTSDERQPSRGRWRRGRVWAWFAAMSSMAVILAALAPTLAALDPLRTWLVNRATRGLNARVTIGHARFGWLSPIGLYNIEVQPPEGPALLSMVAVEGDRPLWRLLWERNDLGKFRFIKPHACLVVGPEGTNLRELAAGPTAESRPHKLELPPVAVSLQIVDATITLEGEEDRAGSPSLGRPQGEEASRSPNAWDAAGINLTAGLVHAQDDPAAMVLIVERGLVLNRAHLNPEVCRAWLQYIAPVLANATRAEGTFSLDLDDWRIPLGDPSRGQLGGRLKIHAAEVVPGPIVQLLAGLFGAPPNLLFARDATVEFDLHDQRIFHRNLEFAVSALAVRTHGSVGLDQALDLMAEVTLPHFANQEAPIRRTLSGRTLTIPIRGTLAKPEVDRQAVTTGGLGLLGEALDALLADRLLSQPVAGGAAAENQADEVGAGGATGSPQVELPRLEEFLRSALAGRRRWRTPADEDQSPASLPDDAGMSPPSGASDAAPEPPPRRRIRRLLDFIEGQIAPPPRQKHLPPLGPDGL